MGEIEGEKAMKHLFIINPVAGKGKALEYIPKIKDFFSRRQDDMYFIETTEKPGHAVDLVKQYVSKDTYRVYSVGGDGTLNEVLNGIAGSDSSLAVIPAGSGNDFVKSLVNYSPLYLSQKDEAKSVLLEKLAHGQEKLADIGRINDRYFINISSIGFDAEVVYNTNRIKKLPLVTGIFAYILGVFSTLISYSKNILRISIDNNSIETDTLLVAVANGRYYGGGMQPAPAASIYDGIFDICLIKGVGRLRILKFFPKFIKGRHSDVKEVSFHRSKQVKIYSNHKVALNVDGEVSMVDGEIDFEIIPGGIKVVIPG